MKNQSLEYFLIGLMIAFTLSVLMQSAAMVLAYESAVIPVRMIWQSFVLAALCSLINLVYRSERLSFAWRSIIGYILTTSTILTCCLVFGWLGFSGSSIEAKVAIIVLFAVCSLFYLLTWLIIRSIYKARAKKLNEKLNEYKNRQ